MNRKTIKSALLGVVLLLLAFLGVSIARKVTDNKSIADKRQTLPDFNFHTLDNRVFTKKKLRKDHTTLVIYFNSTCEHCQYEATALYKQASALQSVNVLWVSNETPQAILTFAKKYKLNQVAHFQVLRAEYNAFFRAFGVSSVPNILVYDSSNKLVKHFKGEVKPEAVLNTVSILR
jgi:peroxiredoxin